MKKLKQSTKDVVINLTHHAVSRMSQRGIGIHDIGLVLDYGREVFSKGVIYYVLSQKEIERHKKTEPKLKELRGISVLVSTHDYRVITVYRNTKNRLFHK